jgi:hypothetical protein
LRLRSAALHVARQRRAVRRALKRIVEVIEGSWWWLARRPWPLVDACMRHTIVGVNQVTLHGVVVVGVAGRCGTWHHCRHVGLEKNPAFTGRGLILQSAGIVGCWRGSAVLNATRKLSGTSILRVRYSTRLASRRQGKLDRVSVQAFTDWRHSHLFSSRAMHTAPAPVSPYSPGCIYTTNHHRPP